MREMKNSGIEWLGEIPDSWSVTRLKYVLAEPMKYGATESGVDYDDDLFRYIRITDITADGKLKEQGKLSLTYAQANGYILRDNAILFARSGGTVGKSFIYRSTYGKAAFAGYLISAYADVTKVLPEWILYFTNCSAYWEWVNRIFTQATIQNIGADKYSNMPIPVAPLPVQDAIVGILDIKCAEIDALAADIQSQIDTLEQYKHSVITEAVTKGLNPDAEMRDSGIPWIGKIPAHWKVMPNKYLMYKQKNICPVYGGEDILSLTMGGVIVRDLNAGGKMPTTFDGYQRIEVGNLLMCLFDIDVTPRCVGLIKQNGLTSPAYSQFVLKSDADAAYYCYYYTMLDNDKTLLHLAKNLRHSLTEDQLGAVFAAVPPLSEQCSIAAFLDAKCTEIDGIIADKKKQIEIIDAYKKSLIFEYVTGKKAVTII